MPVLVVSKTLRLFVNTLTPDDKHFVGNKEILSKPIQFQLCKKLNILFLVFAEFLKSAFDFEHLQKKVESHGLCISEIIDGKRRAYLNV